jgi:hypothetical protein
VGSTLKEKLDTFSQTLIDKAKRLKVRECDEESKGSFVAYVDEGNDSYDVKVVVGKKNELIEEQCDCGKGNKTCIHEVALMLYLTSANQATKTKGSGKKKISPAEAVLESIDVETLKGWLLNLFEKNKDIELAFLTLFNKTEKKYTAEDAFNLTLQGRKAVLKNRRKAEVSEVRKIVALWSNLHSPILEGYWSKPTDELSFQAFMSILSSVTDQVQSIETRSKAMQTYVKEILNKTIPRFLNREDEQWKSSVGKFFEFIQLNNILIAEYVVYFLLDLSVLLDTKRKIYIVEQTLKQYQSIKNAAYFFPVSFHLRILSSVSQEVELADQIATFQPIQYQNDYNLKLIDILIDRKHYDRAERIALDQIKKNVKEEFDYVYYLRLRKLYLASQNFEQFEIIYPKIFLLTFNYEEFQLLYERKAGDEKKNWGKQCYQKAYKAAKGANVIAEVFCFTYLYHHQLIDKMVELVKETRNWETTYRYFEEMYTENANLFLYNMIYRSDFFAIWHNIYDTDNELDFCHVIIEKIYPRYPLADIYAALNAVAVALKKYQRGRFTEILLDSIRPKR